MNKTKVFLSSTCFDLSAVRESLRQLFLKLGHEPILSEYPSFPVSPEEPAIENCKRNVRKHADILVLVIGGKRGSLDSATGKSITNLEYDEARRAGIPCFVFIQRKVIDFLPVWKRNSDTDFKPDVDFPEVFHFVEKIRAENHWTYPFDRTAEIEEVLTHQFSGMLRDLLERSRQGTLDPIADFRGDSEEAQRIARDKPAAWEFRLTAELLRSRLKVIRRKYAKVQSGQYFIPTKPVNGPEFFDWTSQQMGNALKISEAMKLQVDNYSECWGPLGVPGDLREIKLATDDLTHLAEQIIEWAKSGQSINPHPIFEPYRHALCRVMESHLIGMEAIPEKIERMLEQEHAPGSTVHDCITLEADFEPVNTEMAKLRSILERSPELRREVGFE